MSRFLRALFYISYTIFIIMFITKLLPPRPEPEPIPCIETIIQNTIKEELQNSKELKRLEEWLDKWELKEKELSFYAPLDPGAIEGVCYSGNPNITASGNQVNFNTTIAAGPDYPFGTQVYIPEYGTKTVQDRGGAISNQHIDIAIQSRSQAYRNGRYTSEVLVYNP